MSVPDASASRERWKLAVAIVSNPVLAGERLVLLALYALLICARMPDIILRGRFWAEEGPIFFVRAWTLPWNEALFSSHGGYWNIVANTGGLLAHHLANMQSAPFVTTFIALLFQLCPAALILTSREPWLERRGPMIAALLLIALPPLSEEVWLNSLHSQFHLAVCAALILALRPTTGAVELFRRGLLLLGPLAGPGAAVFAPLFLLRAIVDRSPPRLIQTVVIGLGATIQFLVFYTPEASRSHTVTLSLLLSVILVRHVVLPFAGRDQAITTATDLQAMAIQGGLPLWIPMTAAAAVCLVALALLRRRDADLFWLFAAGCCLTVLTYYGAMADLVTLLRPDLGSRYYYASQAIFSLVILGLAATGRDIISKACWVVVVWLLAVGGVEYFSTSDGIAHGPVWHDEVKDWHKDSNHTLSIWPKGWSMKLPAKAVSSSH